MKNKNFATTVAVKFILALLIAFSAVVWFRMLTAKVILPRVGAENRFVRTVLSGTGYELPEHTDETSSQPEKKSSMWQLLYPFASDAPDSIVAPQQKDCDNAWSRLDNGIRERLLDATGTADDFTGKYLPLYDKMTQTANRLNAMIGWDISEPNSYNHVVFLKDGYLGWCNGRNDYLTAAKSLCAFQSFADMADLPLLYVSAAPKINPADTNVYGIADFSNQNAQGLLDAAEAGGVDCYDLRPDIDAAYPDRHKAFFITDLHWKPETGLFAAQLIAKRLNTKMNWDLNSEILSADHFRADVYKRAFFGSQGRKVTLSVAQPEDISFLYPKFETDVHIEIPSIGIDKQGSFSVMYNQGMLNTIKNGNPDYNRFIPFEAYMYSGNPLTIIQNARSDNDLRLLVIHDSFGRDTVPFLSLCVREIVSVDLRKFDGSLETFIETEGPFDAAVILYNPGAISLQSEGKLLFDFR